MGSDYIRVGIAAEIMDVSVDTMKRYAERGLIECTRTPSGHRRFRRVDVERLRAETIDRWRGAAARAAS